MLHRNICTMVGSLIRVSDNHQLFAKKWIDYARCFACARAKVSEQQSVFAGVLAR